MLVFTMILGLEGLEGEGGGTDKEQGARSEAFGDGFPIASGTRLSTGAKTSDKPIANQLKPKLCPSRCAATTPGWLGLLAAPDWLAGWLAGAHY